MQRPHQSNVPRVELPALRLPTGPARSCSLFSLAEDLPTARKIRHSHSLRPVDASWASELQSARTQDKLPDCGPLKTRCQVESSLQKSRTEPHAAGTSGRAGDVAGDGGGSSRREDVSGLIGILIEVGAR